MFTLAAVLIGLQGLAMLVDEFYFHRKRGLGPWERVGHPVDSVAFLIPIVISLFSFSAFTAVLYVVSAVFSCLIITKDEWVHTKECEALENWLHAILFMLHPAILLLIYFLWQNGANQLLSLGLAATVTAFTSYQIFAWNSWATVKNQIYENSKAHK